MDLLPGERKLDSYMANIIVDRGDYGLGPFPLVGVIVGKRESVGGMLHLTNYRVLFRAHAVNRVRGELSLFLPSISRATAGRFMIRSAVDVTTTTRTYQFIPWRVPVLVQAIEGARRALSAADATKIRRMIADGDGNNLVINKTANALTEAVRIGLKLHSGSGVLSGLSVQDALGWLSGNGK